MKQSGYVVVDLICPSSAILESVGFMKGNEPMKTGDVARRRALDFFSQRRMVKEYFDLYCQLAPAVNRGKKAQHLA